MKYIPKPNTGTLWPNEKKSTPSHPDMRGDLYLDVDFLKEMMSKSEGGLVKFQISAWDNKNRFSVGVSAPYVKQEKPASKPVIDDEEIPF